MGWGIVQPYHFENQKCIQNIKSSQNMQEDKVRPLFRQILSSHTQTLQAHRTLTQAIATNPAILTQLLQLITNPQQPTTPSSPSFFQIITILHPVLIDAFDSLSSDLQDEIRSELLSAVVAQHTNLRTVGALALLVRQILEKDGVDPWIQPLGELMKWAESEQLPVMLAGIEFFLMLHRETPYTQSNCDAQLYKISSFLLQKLFAVFANPQLTEQSRAKLLCLVLQIVKSFSPLDGVNDQAVRGCFDGTFELWMSMFITAIQGTLNLNLSIKKYIMKILVVIFRDMQRFLAFKKYHKPTQIYTIWEFTYRVIPLFIYGHVWGEDINHYPPQPKKQGEQKQEDDYLSYDDQSDALCSTVQALALASLDYLSVLLSIPMLQGALKISTHHLTNALFHYLLISGEEQAGWKTNAQHFSSQLGSLEYETGVRGRCLSILNEMIQKFGNLSIQAILVSSQKFLLNLPQSATVTTFSTILNASIEIQALPAISGGIYESDTQLMNLAKISGVDIRSQLQVSGQTWHKVETALLVLGRFSEDVIVFQSNQGGSFDIESFVKGIMRQVREEDYYSLLKGQSLFCLTRFIEIISIKFRGLFTQLFAAAVACNLPGAPLSLRVISCKAASSFLKKIDKHKLEMSKDALELSSQVQAIERVCEIPLLPETTSAVLEVLVELCKNKELDKLNRPPAAYFLALFHQCLSQQSLIHSFLTLLQGTISEYSTFASLSSVFLSFTDECLKAYLGAIKSQQKKFLKTADTQLVITSLQVASVFVNKCSQHEESDTQKEQMIELFAPSLDIMDVNEDVPLQVAFSLFLKNIVKVGQNIFSGKKEYTDMVVQLVRILLRIPKDKSFESASIYAGNLAVILFDRILGKKHNQILQQIVLKVFRSRTPSVIQSLVLVYARIINQGVTPQKKFVLTGEEETRAKDVVDFLSSFSIENRMGLKILVDKWLLQQSLFRGKYTKTATFMALSRLFLLNDKRVDNLLVIGFNPSHTNVNNDVNAPLKIMATLIRCLDNQVAGPRGNQSDSQQQDGRMEMKEEGLNVDLQKFKQEQIRSEQQKVGGSLADRQNQQGSTCYMSAMLQFYDDGQQCDDKTQEDLIYLQDSSINFTLSDYLKDFFSYLVENRGDYFRECIKGLLKQDVKTLQKYVKF